MGTAMARNLIKAGVPVVVYNRNPAKCAELVREGAKQAPTASRRRLLIGLKRRQDDYSKHCF